MIVLYKVQTTLKYLPNLGFVNISMNKTLKVACSGVLIGDKLPPFFIIDDT